jgi:hypothetical protein
MLRSFLALAWFLLAASAQAQVPCQGGTQSAPACSRNWSAGPLSVQACPAPDASTEPGVRVVVRELDGTALLSVAAGSPGAVVSLPTSSAPLAPATAPARVLKFSCEDASGRAGVDTFASVTFPVRARPAAPVLP